MALSMRRWSGRGACVVTTEAPSRLVPASTPQPWCGGRGERARLQAPTPLIHNGCRCVTRPRQPFCINRRLTFTGPARGPAPAAAVSVRVPAWVARPQGGRRWQTAGRGSRFAGSRGRQRGARSGAVARPGRDRRRMGWVVALARPAVAGALVGAGPARSRRLTAAIWVHLRHPRRRGRRYRRARCPRCRAGTFAGRRRRPGLGQRQVHRVGAGGHRPRNQGRLDRCGSGSGAGRGPPVTGLVRLTRRRRRPLPARVRSGRPAGRR